MVAPSVYGEIQSLISLLIIISVPASTLILVVTKYAAKMKAEDDAGGVRALFKYLNKKIFLYSIPFLLLALLFTPIIKKFFNISESLPIFFLWAVMFFSFLSSVTTGILSGWQKFTHISISGVFGSVLKLLAVLILLKIGAGASGVIGSYVLAAIFGYLTMWYFIGKIFTDNFSSSVSKISDTSFSSLKSYVLPVFYGTLSLAILGNIDMIFAKHNLDAVSAGEYGALSVVARTIFFVTGVLTTVLFAMSSEENSGSGKSSRTFHIAAWTTGAVSLVSVVFFSLFPSFVMDLLFGEKYVGVSHYLVWFAIIAGLYSVANLFLQYLLSFRETKMTAVFLALTGIEIITLVFFGRTFYAIIAITLVTQLLAVLGGLYFIWKKKTYATDYISSSTGF